MAKQTVRSGLTEPQTIAKCHSAIIVPSRELSMNEFTNIFVYSKKLRYITQQPIVKLTLYRKTTSIKLLCLYLFNITQNHQIHTTSSLLLAASCLWAEPQGGWALFRPPTTCPPRAWLRRQRGHMGSGWHTAPQLGKSQSVGVDDLPALHRTSGEGWPSGMPPHPQTTHLTRKIRNGIYSVMKRMVDKLTLSKMSLVGATPGERSYVKPMGHQSNHVY